MNTAKKVLILTYYWPPSGGSGVQRWVYFAKHLKALGWIPYVVTVHERYASYPVLDTSLEAEIADIQVYKTKTREPLKAFSLLTTASQKKGIPQGAVSGKGWFSKLARFIRGNFYIPDARKGWNSYAAVEALQVIKREGIKTVITTGPPHSTHLIGMLFKAGLKMTWLADFRDPWSDVFYNKQFYRTPWAKSSDRKLEKQVLKGADAVLTTVGGPFHKQLQKKAPRQKFYALPNGFDAALLSGIPRTKTAEFHIVFTGLLTHNQDFTSVIHAIHALRTEAKDLSIQLSLAGQISPQIIAEIQQSLPHVKVMAMGYLSHKEAVRLMKSAHLLLNFVFKGAETQMISGKLLEYLATELPVLSIGDPFSEAGELLAKGLYSKMLHSEDTVEIKNFITTIAVHKDQLVNKIPDLRQWSREAITTNLVTILERLQARDRL